MKNEEEFFDEECELGCGCDLDEDEFDDDGELVEKPKRNKKKEKTADDYVAVLRTYFDEVIFEERSIEWTSENELDDDRHYRSANGPYLQCRDVVNDVQNLNPDISYVIWFEMQFKGAMESYVIETLKYLIENMKLLKAEDISYLVPERYVIVDNAHTKVKGLPSTAIVESHCGIKRPSVEDWAMEFKRVIGFVFSEHTLYDPKNPHTERTDDYWLDVGPFWCEESERFLEDGVEPMRLFYHFAGSCRLYLGPRFQGQYSNGEKYNYHWLWSDGVYHWHDRNGFVYSLDLVNGSDIIEWLYEFTGWHRVEHDLETEKIEKVKAFVTGCQQHLKWSYREMEESEIPGASLESLDAIGKSAKSVKEFRKLITGGFKYDPNGSGGRGAWGDLLNVHANQCLDKKNADCYLGLEPRTAEYLGIDVSQYELSRWYGYGVFDSKKHDVFEVLFEHYHPKVAVLDLFSVYDDEEEDVAPAGAVRNTADTATQLSLF
ncbi:hypothetical protein ACXWTF_12965 [Thiomicrolovo sp. ZZH C-3]